MRPQLSQKSLEEVQSVCERAKEILISSGHDARIGQRSGMAYPLVKKGVWTIALLLDTGRGWACPNHQVIQRPHWDWFLTTNMDMVDVSIMTGLPIALLRKTKSPELLAATIESSIDDPCRIPNGRCSKEFKCPQCVLGWDRKNIEKGVVGRSFLDEWSVEPTEGSIPSLNYDQGKLELLFGKDGWGRD